jgi:hypothetical protein
MNVSGLLPESALCVSMVPLRRLGKARQVEQKDSVRIDDKLIPTRGKAGNVTAGAAGWAPVHGPHTHQLIQRPCNSPR